MIHQALLVISNCVGTMSSKAATLTVNVPTSITKQPVSQTVTAGRWRRSPQPKREQHRSAISGRRIPQLTPEQRVELPHSSYDEYAQRRPVHGGGKQLGSVASNAATVTVNPAPGTLIASARVEREARDSR
jgi:hypothetical protein